jgi:antirestriction protein ArdC
MRHSPGHGIMCLMPIGITSHAARCHRELGKRFGDAAYAMEELVAELGAAFLCADLGITAGPRADHAQYLDHWLGVMKADKKAIFTAASKASEAAAFLAALQGA